MPSTPYALITSAYCGLILEPFRFFLTSLSLHCRTEQNGWDVTVSHLWHIQEHCFLTSMIETAVCDYKFLFDLLSKQEETNSLWSNTVHSHFGTTTNTCIEVPSDHQVVRWLRSCGEFLQISAEFPLIGTHDRQNTQVDKRNSLDEFTHWPVTLKISNHLEVQYLRKKRPRPHPPNFISFLWYVCNH